MYIPFQLLQNHSEPKLGTEYTPQCKNIPILALSYHSGNFRVSKSFQSGLKFFDLTFPSETEFPRLFKLYFIAFARHPNNNNMNIRIFL